MPCFTIGEIVGGSGGVWGQVVGVEGPRVTAAGGGRTTDGNNGVGALVVLIHVIK